jgi:hypothetical protein
MEDKQMFKVTVDMLKQIRARTDANPFDCKKALEETEGNIDEALELLNKSGASIKRSPEKIAEMAEAYYKSEEYINAVNRDKPAHEELKKYELPELPLKLEEYYCNIPDEGISVHIGLCIEVYPKTSINICMDGYRFILDDNGGWKDSSLEGEWDKNWIMIADYNADPIIADISVDNIPVKYAFHGAGRWDFKPLFNNIWNFWKFIKLVMDKSEETDDFHEYLSKEYDNFIELLEKEFSEEEIEGIMDFFELDEYEE